VRVKLDVQKPLKSVVSLVRAGNRELFLVKYERTRVQGPWGWYPPATSFGVQRSQSSLEYKEWINQNMAEEELEDIGLGKAYVLTFLYESS
jgi:hypothetical protein